MTQNLELQERMDAAFDNYIVLSTIMRDDLAGLLESQNGDQHWKRTFIRTSAALFEGYTHCLREMCAISFECRAPALSKDETAALRSEGEFSTNDRIRLTLRAAYRLFELEPVPDFGGQGWSRAQQIFKKRHLLMHPKTSNDLAVDDKYWIEIYSGVSWLLRQFIQLFVLLQAKIAED